MTKQMQSLFVVHLFALGLVDSNHSLVLPTKYIVRASEPNTDKPIIQIHLKNFCLVGKDVLMRRISEELQIRSQLHNCKKRRDLLPNKKGVHSVMCENCYLWMRHSIVVGTLGCHSGGQTFNSHSDLHAHFRLSLSPCGLLWLDQLSGDFATDTWRGPAMQLLGGL